MNCAATSRRVSSLVRLAFRLPEAPYHLSTLQRAFIVKPVSPQCAWGDFPSLVLSVSSALQPGAASAGLFNAEISQHIFYRESEILLIKTDRLCIFHNMREWLRLHLRTSTTTLPRFWPRISLSNATNTFSIPCVSSKSPVNLSSSYQRFKGA